MQTTTSRSLVRFIRTVLLLALCLSTFGVAQAQPAVTVLVNQQAVSVFDRESIAEVLKRAGVRVRYGVMYSAGLGIPLDSEHNPPVIRLNGQPAEVTDRVGPGDHIETQDGADAWEPLEIDQILISTGLPEVEHRLWNPGATGMDEVYRGAISGEIVSEGNAVPMVPATPEEAPMVALTFDDGPDPRWTIPILETLQREGIRATFCVVGRQARRFPELILRIVEEGHVLCDHTETHPEGFARLSPPEIDQEIGTSSFYLRSLTGEQPRFFRAPGGSLSDVVIRSAKVRGMRVLAWSVDPRDFEGPPPGELQRRVMNRVGPGSVILLHDGGGIRSSTVAALPGLITQLRAEGYDFRIP